MKVEGMATTRNLNCGISVSIFTDLAERHLLRLFIGTLSKTKKTLTKHQAQMQTRLTALCLKRWVGNVQFEAFSR